MRAAFSVAFECADDAARWHRLFSMSPFDGLSPFAASSVVTSALHMSGTRLLNAMVVGSVSLFR